MKKSTQLPLLLVILGSTASGKSDLAIKFAKKFNGEIVNADSRQVYKGMVVGTGSPFPETKGIPHHLFHIIRPNEEFTVAHYKEAALKAIASIHARGKLPILVGGTGLYIRVVVENLSIPVVKPNRKLREQFEQELTNVCHPELAEGSLQASLRDSSSRQGGTQNDKRKKVIQKYYQKLLKLDPHTTVDPHNPRRIIRALEICLATKKPLSEVQQKGAPLFNVLQIGIKVPRKNLYHRIDKRVKKMFKQGLIQETKKLLKKYPLSLPAMSGIGYREVAELLASSAGRSPSAKSTAIERMKFRTHAYARRQMTWFRKNKSIKWRQKNEDIVIVVKKWYTYFHKN